MNDARPRIGISACLIGQPVRWDGKSKKDAFLIGQLDRHVDMLPVCPELELGLGVPRPPIRLAQATREGEIRLRVVDSGDDLTDRMRAFSERRVEALAGEGLSGYVLKRDSPSCGMERVKVYDWNGSPSKMGVGVFAEALQQRFPLLPIEEEGRLCDPRLREHFVERIYAYDRVSKVFAGSWRYGDVVAFHSREKFQLLAHDEQRYRELGRLVAHGKQLPREELAARYRQLYLEAFRTLATRGRNTNVLHHMAGFVKRRLDAEGRAELARLIDDYRTGLVPLAVPVTQLRHHIRHHRVDYLSRQTWLEPYPRDLCLRNAV